MTKKIQNKEESEREKERDEILRRRKLREDMSDAIMKHVFPAPNYKAFFSCERVRESYTEILSLLCEEEIPGPSEFENMLQRAYAIGVERAMCVIFEECSREQGIDKGTAQILANRSCGYQRYGGYFE